MLTNKSLENLSSPLSCTLCTEHSYFFNKMLHTLSTYSLFCALWWITQENPVCPSLHSAAVTRPVQWHRWIPLCEGKVGKVSLLPKMAHVLHSGGAALVFKQTDGVPEWVQAPMSGVTTICNSQVELPSCRLWNAHKLLSPQDFQLSGKSVIPYKGHVWVNLCGIH